MGPRFDRRWMVVRPDGSFVTQRETPRLATIQPTVGDDALTLEAPDAPALHLPLTPRGERLRATVWSSAVDVRTVSPAADAWLSSVLGSEHRLVFMGDDDLRHTDPAYAEGHRVSFADGYPALLVSRGSVDELARRRRPEHPGGGASAPTSWSAETDPTKRTSGRSSRSAASPSAASSCARAARSRPPTSRRASATRSRSRSERWPATAASRAWSYFGVNTVHLATGPISLGDPVEVHERGIVRGAM